MQATVGCSRPSLEQLLSTLWLPPTSPSCTALDLFPYPTPMPFQDPGLAAALICLHQTSYSLQA